MEGTMAGIDTAWMALGLFLLACGAVPALMALAADGAGRQIQPRTAFQLSREEVRGAAPAALERIRRALVPRLPAPTRPEGAAWE
jgi:hypothetical protein